ILTALVYARRWVIKGRLVVRSEHNRTTKSTRPTSRPLPCGSIARRARCWTCGSNTGCLEFLLGEVSHFSRERDSIRAHFSGLFDADLVALKGEHFHETQ